ncbi:helix-turn-helix transcriptional regulator [Streptomyces sp. P9-A2]|uniref:helix-turn-helix transcriptional regulator n=1 Tax=Streptomyces sp. P9-A2 TaxID=3072284 RepID=UPI002FC7D1AA
MTRPAQEEPLSPVESLSERDDALRLLAASAERACEGSGRLVLLRGATGTGRTALLEAAAEQATALGMRVLRARSTPEDTGAHWATLRQLLGDGMDFTDNVLAGCGAAGPGDPGAADPRAYSARLWRLLRRQADRAPLFVAVDDVHTADPSSRRWLTEAARRLDRLPVLLVVTERCQYDIDPPDAGLAHALPPDLVRTHTLAPLSTDTAAELVRAAFPGAGPGRVADCVRAGAGNPLLLRALLDDLASGGWTGEPVPPAELPDTCAALYPGGYPDAVSWWLASAGGATSAVARALAVLETGGAWTAPGARTLPDARVTTETGARATRAPSAGDGAPAADGGVSGRGGWPGACTAEHREVQAQVIARMAQVDAARVAGWLTAMTRLGLLCQDADGLPRYAHPLLRDAVLSGWTSGRRRAAHRTAAEELMRRGADVAVVAGYLAHSSVVAESWAVDVLVQAAAAEVRAGRARAAVAFLRRALDEPMASGRRATVLIQLGSLECAEHPSGGITRLTEAVRLPGSSRDLVRAMVALATALSRNGETPAALRVLRTEEARLTDHPDLVRTLRAVAVLISDHELGALREEYRRRRGPDGDTPDLLGTAHRALIVRYEAMAGLVSSRDAMARIRGLLEEPADSLAEPFLLCTAAAVAQWADELDEAERLVRRALDTLGSFLLHPMHHVLLDVRVDLAAARADFATVLADPRARPSVNGHSGPGPTSAHTQAVIALVETGQLEEAARLVDGFDPRTAQDSWRTHRFLYARGVLRAAAGDPAAALDDFLECGRRQTVREAARSVVAPWRIGAAECRLALGRPREALALAEEELRLAEVWHTPRVLGRALRVLGEATGGRRGLELTGRAVEVLREGPVGTELISALVSHGRRLAASGERSHARKPLREAVERAERLGAVRLRTVAEGLLHEGGARRAGAPRTGPAALTDSERRIAGLAAEGRTNAEIAALLHLARRTVETHLTASYRKLGIRRRTELPTTLSLDTGGA